MKVLKKDLKEMIPFQCYTDVQFFLLFYPRKLQIKYKTDPCKVILVGCVTHAQIILS